MIFVCVQTLAAIKPPVFIASMDLIIAAHKQTYKPSACQNLYICCTNKEAVSSSNARGKTPAEQNTMDDNYLQATTIQKMLTRLLVEKQIPQKNLAKALNITAFELNQLFKQPFPGLTQKTSLTLVKLYCSIFSKRPTNHRFAHITHNKITKYHYFGKQHYVII